VQTSFYDQWQTIAAAIAFMIVGPAIFFLMPVFIGALAEAFGFSDWQLGFMGAADLMGMALASMVMVKMVRTRNWRWLAAAGLTIAITGNLTSLAVTDFTTLLVVRLMTGLGGGMIAGVVSAYVARTNHPDRVAAFLVIGQVTFTVIALYASPWYLSQWGVSSIFGGLAGLLTILFLLLRFLPTGSESYVAEDIAGDRTHFIVPVFIILTSFVFFFIGHAAIWAFVERIGDSAGLNTEYIASALALSTFISILGAVTAAILDVRIGRFAPLLVAGIAQIICFYVMMNGMGAVAFLVALAVFQFFWNFALPYHMGVIIHRDPSASYIVLVPTFQAMGIALGPALAGLAADGGSYTGVNLISMVALGIYLVMILPLSRMKS
jgi:DHA1 family inner membrane transport protein